MKTIKSKVLVSLLAFALAVTSIATPSVSAEAASAKAVKSVTLKVNNKKVNSKTTTLTVGKTLTVKTTVNPSSAKKSISYKTSNKKIATVSRKGKVKAVKAGTAKITVTVKGKNNKTKSAWFKVKVTKKATPTKAPTATPAPQEVAVTKVTLTASATTIAAGQTAQVFAEIQPTNATNKSLTYTSSDETVATITNTGIVSALKDGETTITATAANGVKGILAISVKTVAPTSMSLNASTLDLAVGATSVLSTVFVPENTTERNVTWTSDKESVAKVDGNGTVTAIGEGTAVITATSENGLTATCTVTVKAKTNDNTNGVTISVANSLKDYNNTVFTGNNADVKVRVYKDGKPAGNTDVTLKMEHKSADNYWYISNNQSTTSTVKTDSQGIASFTISLMPGCDYDATDGVMGGYLLIATATGASTTAQAPLTFARFTVGSAYSRIASNEYSFSNITVNGVLTNLVQGQNAAAVADPETKTVERRIINVSKNQNELIGTSEYVVSQQTSTKGTSDRAVTFNAAPLIEYPEVITGTNDDDYKKNLDYTSGEYDVYDTSKSTYIQEVPTNLNWAKIQFKSASVSQHAALKIDVFADYDSEGNPVGAPIRTYAIIGEYVENNFGFSIPIQELASEASVGDYVLIKVYIQTEGQVDLERAKLGYSLDYISGNYVGTSKYKNISEIYQPASIEWKKVNKPGTNDDSILTASYQNKVKMTDEEACAYGIDTKSPGSNYFKATVEYKIPNYPHIGDAYVTVTKQNKEVEYFMIPTYTKDNINKLMPASEVQAFRASVEEALNYVGTMTSDKATVTVNSEESGVTEVYGYLTVPELDYLTTEERRLFAYVNWAPNPEEEERPVEDFYALVGQTITVDALVTDNNGNLKSDEEVSFYLNRDLDDEVKLTKDTLVSGVTITNDSSKFDDTKYTVKTDANGVAHISFRSDSYANGIFEKDLSAKCAGYNVAISVNGVPATYAKLYWIAPGLSFTDQTQVKAGEAKDENGTAEQVKTTTVSYQQASKEAGQTATQDKFVGTKWKIGYEFVGYVNGSKKNPTLESAAADNFSNVAISGLGADVGLWKYATEKTAPNGTEIDAENKKKEDASIKITSEKVGTDLVEATLDNTTISKDADITFTLLDDFGTPIKTVKNSGKGETSAHVGLNVPIKWKPTDMLYDIVATSGNNFAVVSDNREDTVYVRVYDSRDNMLDGYEVKWTVKKTDAAGNAKDITAEVMAYMGKKEAVAKSKNGLVAIKYKAPKEKCTYEFTATVEGNDTKPTYVNYVEKVASTSDLGMQTAVVDETTQTITLTLSNKVNKDTVLADMFTVKDDTGKGYEVTIDSVTDNVVKLKLGNAINNSAKYINVTYNEVVENLDKGVTACRMVSLGNSPVVMKNGFTVTAYTSALPTIKYEVGTVTATKNTLYNGAYVIFIYGTTVKSVEVTGNKATDAGAAVAEEVTAYTGNVSTSINAAPEAEVVEETVEAETAEATTEDVEEVSVEEAAAEDAIEE